MSVNQHAHPTWYTDEDDTAWEKIKAAFQRDWQQTQYDFGGQEPNLNQQAGDTLWQAMGTESIPPTNMPTPHPATNDIELYTEDDEPAYRYGYAAGRRFGSHADWNDQTEAFLREDWDDETEWERQREAIRRGWTYGKTHRIPAGE